MIRKTIGDHSRKDAVYQINVTDDVHQKWRQGHKDGGDHPSEKDDQVDHHFDDIVTIADLPGQIHGG